MIASVQIASAARAFPDAVPVSSGGSEASTPASFQSVLHQYHSPAEQDNEESSTPQNSQHSRQDSSPARTPTGEPQNAATASKADPKSALATAQDQGPDATATSGADGASTSANFRVMLHRFRSTRGPGFEASDVPVSSQQKTTDLTQTVAAPLLATHTVEPRLTLPLTASITLRQDGTASQSNSAAPQAAMLETETDQAMAVPPPRVQADETATVSAGSMAFAARLSPNAETQPPVSGALRTAEQTSLQTATQTAAKQVAAGANESPDARSNEGGDPSPRQNLGDLFAKPDALLMQTPAAAPDHTATAVRNDLSNDTPATLMSPMARMDKVIEPPATQTNTNHDITIRIPDATEQGTAVRFVERGGEVHVSVRTGDAEMAQTLRGGLNDLVNRLQDGGIRTEVWQPGSDASSSQDDLHHPFADPDGSNGNPPSSGSNSEQESSQQNKPRWVEELEDSIGNPKETSQLWQA